MTDISLSMVSVQGGRIKSWCHTLFDSNNPRLVDLAPGGQNKEFESHHIEAETDLDLISHPKRRKVDDRNTDLHEKFELKAGEKICVVSITELPSFERGPKHSCSLMLSWTRYHDNEPPCRKANVCGYVDLSVDQLDELSISNTTGRPRDMVARRHDVLAVRAVSMETMVSVSWSSWAT